ncbi:flagellar biosynthetic protein FliQ [Jatrophihabitans telluris]|uniref:Flagellar biosynthetic protein FliQ n=1 Tax=Jatrophihabitans telluris TaxID=2038343 RepID=A0ABY4QXN3_9ACTN|nr:flagellar biosynthetic protein FliQ [Jatrophihabitans telluris]UQX87967.1 flagellar biosynthetic protein FliQ [Jatrophihabitans telluris]
MTDTAIVHLGMKSMLIAFQLAAPTLLTALLIGFGVSLFQSATQIQEVTLAFVPKAIGVGVALLLSGSWMMHSMITFTQQLFAELPSLLNS